VSGTPVQRVTTFKLLGVYVAINLKWSQHVEAISSKAASRLHFLKQLKRLGAGRNDLLCFYGAVIRPVLEYACPVWHSSITAGVDGIRRSGQSGTVENGGVENAGVDISARCGKGGHCRSGQCGTVWQGWSNVNAGVDLSARNVKSGQCGRKKVST